MSTASRPPPNFPAAAAVIGIIALSVYLMIEGEAIFVPLVLAIFISYLLVASAHMLQRIKIGARRAPLALAMTVAIILLILTVAVMVQIVAGNIAAVADAAPQYQERLTGLLKQANEMLAAVFHQTQPITLAGVLDQIDLRVLAKELGGTFQSIAGNTFQIIIYVVFILLEMRTFDHKLTVMFPDPSREHAIRSTIEQIGPKIEAYVWVKTVLSLSVGILTYVTLKLLGVDFAAFWGLLNFILSFIPYIGALIGIVFPVLLALLQFGSFLKALMVLAILVSIQSIIDNVIGPRMTGKSVNMSPVVMMVGLSVWGAIWGITGMILSVPILVITMIVLAQFPRTRPLAILMSENGDIPDTDTAAP